MVGSSAQCGPTGSKPQSVNVSVGHSAPSGPKDPVGVYRVGTKRILVFNRHVEGERSASVINADYLLSSQESPSWLQRHSVDALGSDYCRDGGLYQEGHARPVFGRKPKGTIHRDILRSRSAEVSKHDSYRVSSSYVRGIWTGGSLDHNISTFRCLKCSLCGVRCQFGGTRGYLSESQSVPHVLSLLFHCNSLFVHRAPLEKPSPAKARVARAVAIVLHMSHPPDGELLLASVAVCCFFQDAISEVSLLIAAGVGSGCSDSWVLLFVRLRTVPYCSEWLSCDLGVVAVIGQAGSPQNTRAVWIAWTHCSARLALFDAWTIGSAREFGETANWRRLERFALPGMAGIRIPARSGRSGAATC